ncbi:hypothetical protein M405DRAFT_811064 [Rhizopogon salebrosus TDB-379]|nr:hypothetical protein M405DRAFT_811064 [Rhizopogon salebrosus TDB-379]
MTVQGDGYLHLHCVCRTLRLFLQGLWQLVRANLISVPHEIGRRKSSAVSPSVTVLLFYRSNVLSPSNGASRYLSPNHHLKPAKPLICPPL